MTPAQITALKARAQFFEREAATLRAELALAHDRASVLQAKTRHAQKYGGNCYNASRSKKPQTSENTTTSERPSLDLLKKEQEPYQAPKARIKFDRDAREFTGIIPADLEAWGDAFRGLDIDATLRRMAIWLADKGYRSTGHPRYRDFSRFIRTWLGREYDRLKATQPAPRQSINDKWADYYRTHSPGRILI